MTPTLITRLQSEGASREVDEEARLERERALAAEMFPREWAAALKVTGKRGNNRRANLRKRALNEQAMIPLRAKGATCATCRHRRRVAGIAEPVCDLDSDFHGYAITALDRLCPDWSLRNGARLPTLKAQET